MRNLKASQTSSYRLCTTVNCFIDCRTGLATLLVAKYTNKYVFIFLIFVLYIFCKCGSGRRGGERGARPFRRLKEGPSCRKFGGEFGFGFIGVPVADVHGSKFGRTGRRRRRTRRGLGGRGGRGRGVRGGEVVGGEAPL